ncbi:MAG: thioredoxin [Vicinamibacterales bacterium]
MALTLDEKGVIVACPQCRRANRIAFGRVNAATRCAQCKTELPGVDAPAEVRSVAQFDALMSQSAVPVLVDFWAAWCGPCRMVAPEVEKVARALRGRMLAVKVNTEELPQLAAEFNVRSIPLLAVFRDGHLVEQAAGAMPAASIQQLVERALR